MTKIFPVLVRKLAAGNLEAIANDLFSFRVIDGKVYEGLKEGLKLETKTTFQKAIDVIMIMTSKVSTPNFILFLKILKKQKGMKYLVKSMEKSRSKLCVLDSNCE